MSKKILIFGESNIDEFIYSSVERICPDGPVPVLDIIGKECNIGMAGNVAANVRALGGQCDLITNLNYKKIKKTRLVHEASNHLFLRIDKNETIDRIGNLDKIKYDKYAAVIISDYSKGLLTEKDINFIGKSHKITFLDSKKILGAWANSIKFIKINNTEYNVSKKFLTPKLENKIIRTSGKEGCFYLGKQYPVEEIEVRNMVGAGDTFQSALALKYIETQNIEESIKFANKCATLVVQKKGVSTVSLAELKQHNLI